MTHLNIILTCVVFLSAGAAGQEFTAEPNNTAVRIGEPAVLSCAVDTADRVVEWTYKDTKIYDSKTKTVSDSSQYEVSNDGENHHDLHIKEVKSGNTGLYKCRMPDENKEVDAYLIALGDPVCPDDLELNENDPFDMECKLTFYTDVDGTLKPSPHWYTGKFPYTSENPVYTDNEVKLAISKAAHEDDDEVFTCRVTQFLNTNDDKFDTPVDFPELSCNTTVTVYYPAREIKITPTPEVRDGKNHVKATVGEYVTCSSAGNPEPVVRWLDESDKVVSDTFKLLVTKDMKGERTFKCHAKNTFVGMEKSQYDSVAITAEDPNAGTGSKHDAMLAGTLLVALLALRFIRSR